MRLSIFYVILFLAFAGIFFNFGVAFQLFVVPEPIFSTGPIVVENPPFAVPPIETQAPETKNEQPPDPSTPTASATEKQEDVIPLAPPAPTPPAPEPTAPTELSGTALYAYASARTVNFLCDGKAQSIVTATGIIIHPKGYILTNAHVANDLPRARCLIRQGAPAAAFAYAEEVFHPSRYIPDQNTTENAYRDVSIWKIVESANANKLPDTFAFFEFETSDPTTGASLATFSYAAELLSYDIILKSLYLLFTNTVVTQHDALIIESKETLGSQKGSSGGVLVDRTAGNMRGLIFGVSPEVEIGKRMLYSLTPQAINKAVEEETGKTLAEYLATDP